MPVWRDDMGVEWEGWQQMEKMGGGGLAIQGDKHCCG